MSSIADEQRVFDLKAKCEQLRHSEFYRVCLQELTFSESGALNVRLGSDNPGHIGCMIWDMVFFAQVIPYNEQIIFQIDPNLTPDDDNLAAHLNTLTEIELPTVVDSLNERGKPTNIVIQYGETRRGQLP